MRRGTTPTHTFNTDTDLTDCSVIYLTYMQDGQTILDLDISRMTVTSTSVTVTLTQAETLLFKQNGAMPAVAMQFRAGWSDGSRAASQIMRAPVEKILKDGEI